MTPQKPSDPTTHEPSPNAGLAGVGDMGGSNASNGQPQTASAAAAAGRASTQGDENHSGGVEGFLDRQLQVVASDLESFAKLLTDTLDGSEPKFRQSFRSTIDPLSGKISQLADTIRAQNANQLINRTKETVKSHPLAVVGGIAALAAGLAQVAVVMAKRSENGSSTGASTGLGSAISMGSGSSDMGSPGTSGLGSGGMSH